MKRCFLILIAVVGMNVMAQTTGFDGEWLGYVYDENDEIASYLVIEIEGEEIKQYSYDSRMKEYSVMEFDIQRFVRHRNNAVYTWMNQGGQWTETQTYHLSLVHDDKIEILFTRQVNNVKDGDNEVWEVRRSGYIERIEESPYY
ncbi:MAG: hypothetical protein WD052_06345 [Bacteroidales bacterium]